MIIEPDMYLCHLKVSDEPHCLNEACSSSTSPEYGLSNPTIEPINSSQSQSFRHDLIQVNKNEKVGKAMDSALICASPELIKQNAGSFKAQVDSENSLLKAYLTNKINSQLDDKLFANSAFNMSAELHFQSVRDLIPVLFEGWIMLWENLF